MIIRGRRHIIAAAVAATTIGAAVLVSEPGAASAAGVPTTLTVSVGGCASSATGATTSTTAEVDETRTSTVCATVQDTTGAAAPAVPTTFSVDQGFVTATQNPTSTPTTTSTPAITDAGGHAIAYAGSTKAGTQTVTVRAGTLTETVTVTYHSGKTATISITPTTVAVPAGSDQTFTATLTDRFGNPVYTADGSNNGLLFNQTGPVVTSPGAGSVYRTTGTDGKASVTLEVPPGSTGSGTVTATPLAYSTAKAPSATADYTVSRGAAQTVTVSGLKAIVVGGSETVRAVVTGSDGKALAGARVAFALTNAEGVSTTDGDPTDADGVATATFQILHAGLLYATATAGSVTSAPVSTVIERQAVTFKATAYSKTKGQIVLAALPSPVTDVVAGSTVDFYYNSSSGFTGGPIPVQVSSQGRAQITIRRTSGHTYTFYATIDRDPDIVASNTAHFSVKVK